MDQPLQSMDDYTDTSVARLVVLTGSVVNHRYACFRRSREIYGQNAAAPIEPRTQTHILRELAQSKWKWTFDKSRFILKFTGKMPRPRFRPERGHTLCASLQSTCKSTCDRSHFIRKFIKKNAAAQVEPRAHILCKPLEKFTGKTPRPRLSPERAHTFCASMRCRNASEHLAKATLYGNLRENAAAQLEHPDEAPAFTTTVRTSQCGHIVWGTRIILDRTVSSSEPRHAKGTTLSTQLAAALAKRILLVPNPAQRALLRGHFLNWLQVKGRESFDRWVETARGLRTQERAQQRDFKNVVFAHNLRAPLPHLFLKINVSSNPAPPPTALPELERTPPTETDPLPPLGLQAECSRRRSPASCGASQGS
jgi:hypothetical protein